MIANLKDKSDMTVLRPKAVYKWICIDPNRHAGLFLKVARHQF